MGVDKDDYGFSFDLRYREKMGGSRISSARFGLNDASRKVARRRQTRLNKGRTRGARSAEVHVDDEVRWIPRRERALEWGRKDLKDYGFRGAEDK